MSKAHCLQKKDRLYLFGLLLIVPKLTLYLSLVLVTVLLFLSDEDTLSVNVALQGGKLNVALQGKKLVSIVPKPDSDDATSPNMFKSLAGGLKSDKKCRKVMLL